MQTIHTSHKNASAGEPDTGVTTVSMFASATGKAPQETTLGALLAAIRTGKWEKQIQRARELFAEWKSVCPGLDSKESPEAEAYDAFKKTLPAFCMSGTAASRTKPLQHSGLLQVDCDKLGSTLEAVREKMKSDPHVAFGFVSPSGDGLKLGLRIDGSRHAESFEAAKKYFRERYGVEIDKKVKDRLRLCFVSHDPAAWTRDAEPLPLPDGSAMERQQATPPDNAGVTPEILILPSGDVSISDAALAIFQRIAPSRTIFWRGGALVELVTVDGVQILEIVKPEGFRSRVEKFGNLFAWRSDGEGNPVLKRTKMPLDDAKAFLASTEARELPPVASVLRCPVLVENAGGDVVILGKGYHPDLGGLLIVDGATPPRVPLAEAVSSLRWLVDEFSFQDEGDRSRALAALITPALRTGGHLRDHIPIDVAEADHSQAGKGYRHKIVCALYNEAGYFVTPKTGGVGSVDESFAAALVSARPFVCLDNFRGRMDSANLESFLTCRDLFPCRIPHRGEVLVDPKRFILQLSSNGLETTADLANRASICRIRKRPGYAYRDTLRELQRRQGYFLGCVFALIAEWIAHGKPRTRDMLHTFGEWNQTLDWICQNVLGCAPLMDGHVEAQQRTSNPALSWLRAVALGVAGENRLGIPLIASELAEVCESHGIEIPGKPADEDKAKRQIGSLCKALFRESDAVVVDGFTVTRAIRFQQREAGGAVDVKTYSFSK